MIENPSAVTPKSPAARLPTWAPDLIGIVWVLGAAAAVMAPALFHGSSLGPFDILSKFGLTKQRGVVVHNPSTSDQINLFIPWTAMAWTQVHHGLLPLWNPSSLLGMPLAFNWESAPFGLPALLGYLVPLRLAYTVSVLATLAIAGTGVYVLGRVLGLSVLAAVMSATVYELSGRFISTLGWSLGSVMSWAGWMFAIGILLLRGRHRTRDIVCFAVVLALMIYAGYPEGVMVLAAAFVVFLVVQLASRTSRFGGSGNVWRPVGDFALATIAGIALSAPLALPGFQVISLSTRNGQVGVARQTLGARYLVNIIIQGFDGLPWHGSTYFGPATAGSTLTYIGIIVVVLAVLGVAIRRRRPDVLGFGVVATVMALLVFVPPLASLIDRVPGVGSVRLYDALGPMAFAVAVLAGFGVDVLVRQYRNRTVIMWTGGGFAVMALVLLGLWFFDRGHLNPTHSSIRAHSFIWPAVETLLGLLVVGALVLVRRRETQSRTDGRTTRFRAGWWAAISLLVCETIFLVVAGAPTFSSSPTLPRPTPQVLSLKRAVGSSLVAFESSCVHFESLGVPVNFNVFDGVDEFADHDPTVPYSYVQALSAARHAHAGQVTGHTESDLFCPGLTSAETARLFGISFILSNGHARGPSGAIFVKKIGDEKLYRIPGAAAATLTPLLPSGKYPPLYARGSAVAVEHPNPASWKLDLHASGPRVLRLRLTDLPGWHATINGRPLHLESFDHVMLQARVPAGSSVVELHYWPDAFNLGLVVAVVAAGCLLIASLVSIVRHRRRRRLGTES